MFLKKPFGVFVSCVLVFSLCLLLCVDDAWAVTNTDMAVYVAPRQLDPIYYSSRINVPSSGGNFYGSNGYMDSSPIRMKSNVFAPVAYDRTLMIAVGVVSGKGVAINGYTISYPFSLNYRLSGESSWRSANNVFANMTQIDNGSKSSFVLYRITIPANTVEFDVPNMGYYFGNDPGYASDSQVMCTITTYGSWILDSVGNNVDVFERIFRDLNDLNSSMDDIYSVMSVVSNKLDSIDSTVTSIYDLLNSAISESGQELSDSAAQQAQNVAIVEASESDWYNMNDNAINTVGLGNTTLSSGILGGVSVVSSIFVRIWQAVPELSSTITFILVLSLALVIVGRVARTASKNSKPTPSKKE